MPFFRRDKGRGRGSSREKQELNVVNRRSLNDFLGWDTPGPSQAVPAPSSSSHRNDFGGQGSFRWKESGSPEAAQTPRGLVPAACFPPNNSADFTSYSESAEIGIEWHEEVDSTQMTTLVASLESMKLRSQSTRSLFTSAPQSHSLSYDQLEKADQHCAWPVEQAGTSAPNNRSNYLARRASFGGKTSSRDLCRSDENTLVWDGVLPPRCANPEGGFSAKVFLGGLPWDINEQALLKTLKSFHPNRVEWPGRDSGSAPPRGYAYITFENERRVRALLSASRYDGRDWYYRITSRKMRNKEVQVIPWAVSDSNWVSGGSARLEPSRTVFVGALHGMITAAGLAIIMNDLFPGVIYAGIDTDKNKYPIGSGRVTFNNVRSYVRAISAAFIEIHTSKFTKKVQVDPYLEDSMCSVCKLQQGPYFCREPTCFGYFCRSCWTWSHSSYVNESHRPLMRCSKNLQQYAQYLHSFNGVPALQSLPALPAVDTQSIAALESNQIEVFNGGYSLHNEGTPSPPGTNLFSANGAFGAMNGTS